MMLEPETRPGRLLFPGMTHLIQGAHYQFTTLGHRLILSIERPSPAQIAAVETRAGLFGLFVCDEVFLLLAQFGDGPCLAAHYNWWFNSPDIRPNPFTALADAEPQIELQVLLVNASSGVIEAARKYRLTTELTRLLLERVANQIDSEFDPWRHLKIVADVLQQYPNRRDMLLNAVSLCSFGMVASGVNDRKEERPSASAWPAMWN
jgi:hypothetical protein